MCVKQLLFVGVLSYMFWTCDKVDNTNNEICIIQDPINEIIWLDSLTAIFEQMNESSGAEIIQYEYKGQCVFYVDDCENCIDKLIKVYDLDQNVLCEFGGIAGLNTCPDFDQVATDSKLLYKK